MRTLAEMQEATEEALRRLFQRNFRETPENEVIGVALTALHDRLKIIEDEAETSQNPLEK